MGLRTFIVMLVASGIGIASSPVRADDALAGHYTGYYMIRSRGGLEQVAITLDIDRVERGAVTANVSSNWTGPCGGDYRMQGRLQDNTLQLHSMGGRKGDCPLAFKLSREGAKLIGTTATGNEVALSK